MHEAIADCIAVDGAAFPDDSAEEKGTSAATAADPRGHAERRAVNLDLDDAVCVAGSHEGRVFVVSHARRAKRDSIAACLR